jgi:TetR/AcrR family transcriptional repressor of bet genes
MPPLADHDERREHVADVAADLLEQRGLEAVTFRAIAVAAGCSTAIVSHYFTDKRDLLRFVYNAAASRARQRLEAAGADHDVLRALEALLPIDKLSRRDWRVWFSFWGIAVADPEMAAQQRAAVRATRSVIAGVISEAASHGELPPHLDAKQSARDLLVLVMGVAAQAVFDPMDWPPKRQRAFLADHLATIGL